MTPGGQAAPASGARRPRPGAAAPPRSGPVPQPRPRRGRPDAPRPACRRGARGTGGGRMSRALILRRAGPGLTVQDRGRPGLIAEGLSRGGAADRLALLEGAALLGQPPDLAALEITGAGLEVEATAPLRIALTGAPMTARAGDRRLAWNAVHALGAGERLSLAAAKAGVWSYLHVGGGVATPEILGSRAAHLVAGIGKALAQGDEIPVGDDSGGEVNRVLDVADRFTGGEIRVTASAHTHLFPEEVRERFAATGFRRDPRGNRQGMQLGYDGAPFAIDGQRSLPSEVMLPGDIQMTGDGAPYVLLPECQTMGGYPRIATVIPADLPRIAQAAPGTPISFRFVTLEEALAASPGRGPPGRPAPPPAPAGPRPGGGPGPALLPTDQRRHRRPPCQHGVNRCRKWISTPTWARASAPGRWATTRRCSTSSPPPTSPAACMPATGT